MPRLIEVQDAQLCPSPQTVVVGDVLHFHAAGGRLRAGRGIVELLGPFVSSVVGDQGQVMTPMGPPNTLLVRALKPGRAVIDLVTGDPFHAPRKTTVAIVVEHGGAPSGS